MRTFEKVQKATFRVVCGSECGTAFFVSKNKLLTAWHVVSDTLLGYEAYLVVDKKSFLCKVTLVRKETDVALLECSSYDCGSPLSLLSMGKIDEMSLCMFGFPMTRIGEELGQDLELKTCKNYKDLKNCSFDSYAELADPRTLLILKGFSGSPIVVDDESVIGIATEKLDYNIGFVSIENIENELKKEGLLIDSNVNLHDNSPYGWLNNRNFIKNQISRMGNRYKKDLHQEDADLNKKIETLWSELPQRNENDNAKKDNKKKKLPVEMSNFLCVIGNAGVGKTQQMCHYADTLVENKNTNVYLVFGSQFIPEGNLETQIAKICSFSSPNYLDELNKHAERRNVRYLFILDALNEGIDDDFWRRELQVFINKIKRFDNLAFIITIRSPFEREYGLESFRDANNSNLFDRYTINGFSNPLKAKREYFEFYQIDSRHVPTFDFENGLFLSLFCDVYNAVPFYKKEKLKSLFNLFFLYVQQRNEKISQIVDEDSHRNIAKKYLMKLSTASLNPPYGIILRDLAYRISRKMLYRSWSKSLLCAMLNESLLLGSVGNDNQDTIVYEYELMGNVFQAYALFSSKRTEKQQIHFLSDLVDREIDNFRVHNILTVACGLWKEYHNRDIVFSPDFNSKLFPYYLEGSKYKNSISSDELEKVKNDYGNRPFYKLSLKIISNEDNEQLLTVIVDELHNVIRHNLDLWWTEAVNLSYDDGELTVIRDYYIKGKDSQRTEMYRFKLARLLCWICSSSYPIVRANAIRGLVYLFVNHSKLVLQVVEAMASVKDTYVLDGLYSAVYGFVLINSDSRVNAEISEAIYKKNFKDKNLIPDIRIREWILRILDKDRADNGSDYFDKATPPYISDLEMPNGEESLHVIKSNENYFGKSVGSKKLFHSLFGFSDFNRYIIGTNSSQSHYNISSTPINENIPFSEGFNLDKELLLIAKQIKDLGWDDDLGELDNNRTNYNRMENETERIGKKYQWMALYNIEAKLMDYYKIYDWNHEYKKINYPWYNEFRHSYFDPTLLVCFEPSKNEGQLKQAFDFGKEIPNEEWIKKDFKAKSIDYIDLIDSRQRKWVLLKSWQILHSNESQAKDAFIFCNGYFVKKEDDSSFANWISQKELYGRWLPENSDNIDHLLLEYPWTSMINWKEYNSFKEVGQGCPCLILPAVYSHLQEDHMGVNGDFTGSIDLPIPDIMNTLNLHVLPGSNSQKCYCADSKDEVISFSYSEKGIDSIYIRQDALEQYLSKKNYSLFLCFSAEKHLRKSSYDYEANDLKTSSAVLKYTPNGKNNIMWLNDFSTLKEG